MAFSLEKQGITVSEVHRNATPAYLYEAALKFEKGSAISSTGALIAYSGKKTGRSPTDKRVVDEPESRDDVWWGNVNIKLDPQSFTINRERAIDYLNTRERLFVVDAFAGWDPKYRLKIRVITSRAYHALFMHNMLIRPTDARARALRRARLRDLQRRRVPCEPPHRGHDVGDVDRPLARPPRVRDPRIRLRRRDEEGRVHDHELPDAEARRAVDALLGDAGARLERHVDPVRALGHRQDHAVGRSEAPADRRRRALLERHGPVQHRGRLLREDDQAVEGERAGHLERDRVRRRARERQVRSVLAARRLQRHLVHREHARQLHPRHDPERQAAGDRRPSEERHLPDRRRVRRAAARRRS